VKKDERSKENGKKMVAIGAEFGGSCGNGGE